MRKTEIKQGLGRLESRENRIDARHPEAVGKFPATARERHAHAAHDQDVRAVFIDASPGRCEDTFPTAAFPVRKIDNGDADPAYAGEPLDQPERPQARYRAFVSALKRRQNRVSVAELQ